MGKLIVIEGTDGSGKSTQFKLLTQRLTEENCTFRKLVFPRYSEPSSALIRMYLGGEFGTKPSDVNAYVASSFFAVDRFASYKMDWGKWYEEGGLVLSDRYTTSNAVHQASKEPVEKREAYLHWLYDFEYAKMGPRKGLNADTIEALTRMSPKRIVYVSCDPATLARDVALLKDRGYKLKNALAADLFPRCSHVESIVCLVR